MAQWSSAPEFNLWDPPPKKKKFNCALFLDNRRQRGGAWRAADDKAAEFARL